MSAYHKTSSAGAHAHRHGSRGRYGVFFWICWALQLAAEIALFVSVYRLNMLPNALLGLAGIGLLLVAAIALCFLLYKRPAGRRRKLSWLNIFGVVFSLLVTVGCIVGVWATTLLHDSLHSVTAPEPESEELGVYVLAESPHNTLADMGELRFGASSQNGTDADLLLRNVEEAAGTLLKSEIYDSYTALAGALYEKEVDAIVMSKAIAGLLEESDFDDFETRTRLLYEFTLDLQPEAQTDHSADKNVDFVKDENALLLYLSGSDTRNRRLSTSRSDVNLLAAVNFATHQVMIVNTPRDYYVQTTVSGDAYDKLTHAGVYGVKCSIGTLENLYGVGVDYYGQINFTGFEKLIDIIGGVTVYSDVAFTTRHGGYYISQGYNTLNGAQALGFARERYALSGGDNDRGKNQMKLLTAVIEKLSAGTILMNYAQIMDSLDGMFATNVPMEEIGRAVKRQLENNAAWTVHTYAATGRGGSDITYSMPHQQLYVMYPNSASVEKASGLLKTVLSGGAVTDADVAA